MTNEERDFIAKFISRVGGTPQGGGFLGGSVPQTQAPLPPVDREADAFIGEQFQRYPEARYRITQMAAVQEAALAEMNNRLTRLQWELDQAKQQREAAPQPQPSRGLFGGLFGGGSSPAPAPQRGGPWGNAAPGYGGGGYAPPPPQYPPQYQPGMFGGGGSGFLGSALTTAAGVAGGMVVGNALMNAFSGHHGMSSAASFPVSGDGGGGFFGSDQGNTAFDGGGMLPQDDATAGFGGGDPFASGGETKAFDNGGGFAQDTGFDGGGSFDGGGGFDSGGFDSDNS